MKIDMSPEAVAMRILSSRADGGVSAAQIAAAIRHAVLEEREACAVIAEADVCSVENCGTTSCTLGREIAAQIRGRK